MVQHMSGEKNGHKKEHLNDLQAQITLVSYLPYFIWSS